MCSLLAELRADRVDPSDELRRWLRSAGSNLLRLEDVKIDERTVEREPHAVVVEKSD